MRSGVFSIPMAGKHDISEQDAALFRGALAGVRELRQDDRVHNEKKKPPAQRRKRRQETVIDDYMLPDGVLHDAPGFGERQEFCRDGLRSRDWRRLVRGQIPINAELDLHGFRVDAARQAFALFLSECVQLNQRCIRVITGKGFGSRSATPVLKAQVDRWLRLRPEVQAFCSAQPQDGGTGAVYVLLRRSR